MDGSERAPRRLAPLFCNDQIDIAQFQRKFDSLADTVEARGSERELDLVLTVGHRLDEYSSDLVTKDDLLKALQDDLGVADERRLLRTSIA